MDPPPEAWAQTYRRSVCYSELMLGVAYALVALVGWAVGDFFIQKSIRRIGLHETLFMVAVGASVFLLPFVWDEVATLTVRDMVLLSCVSIIMHAYAFMIFNAFKQGKLSVVESIAGFELPLTVALSIGIAGEVLAPAHAVIVGVVILGIILAATKNLHHLRGQGMFERGAFLAIVAVFLSSLANFSVGLSAKHISPLLVVWVIHVMLVVLRGAILIYLGRVRTLVRGVVAHPIVGVSGVVLDNAAWTGFALAVPLIGIALTTTISESYIALAVLLGVLVNKERLRPHQFFGASMAIAGVVVCAYLTPA